MSILFFFTFGKLTKDYRFSSNRNREKDLYKRFYFVCFKNKQKVCVPLLCHVVHIVLIPFFLFILLFLFIIYYYIVKNFTNNLLPTIFVLSLFFLTSAFSKKCDEQLGYHFIALYWFSIIWNNRRKWAI